MIKARIKAIKEGGEAKDKGSRRKGKGNIQKKKQSERVSKGNTTGT